MNSLISIIKFDKNRLKTWIKKIEDTIYVLISDILFLRGHFISFKIKYFEFLEREYQNYIVNLFTRYSFVFYNKSKNNKIKNSTLFGYDLYGDKRLLQEIIVNNCT